MLSIRNADFDEPAAVPVTRAHAKKTMAATQLKFPSIAHLPGRREHEVGRTGYRAAS